MPAAADAFRVEAISIEKTLALPADRLRDWLIESVSGAGQNRADQAVAAATLDFVTTPWERVRARRVNRLLYTAAIRDAMLEPWQRAGREAGGLRDPVVRDAEATTPLFGRWLIPGATPSLAAADATEVARRALVQVLAIRAWQLEHDGAFPEHLAALVPNELPGLPLDPYSGRPFGYVRSRGQEVFPLGDFPADATSPVQAVPRVPPAGSWLLYSVGRDGRDDRGTTFTNNHTLDMVFAIPPVERGGAHNVPDRNDSSNRRAPSAVGPAPPG
jgi:hypothetical protein